MHGMQFRIVPSGTDGMYLSDGIPIRRPPAIVRSGVLSSTWYHTVPSQPRNIDTVCYCIPWFYETSDPKEQKQNVALLENATIKVLVRENYVISGLIYIIHMCNDLQSGYYSMMNVLRLLKGKEEQQRNTYTFSRWLVLEFALSYF